MASSAEEVDTLSPLVELLNETDDPQLQLDVLRGMSDGLKGRREIKPPQGWDTLEQKLGNSPDAQIRDLVKSLSLTFGSSAALASLRETLTNPKAELAARTNALNSLLQSRDAGVVPSLHELVRDPVLRGAAIRALAVFDHSKTPDVVLGAYPSLTASEQRDALNTLAARPGYARVLMAAVAAKTVPARDLTADVVRQLRAFKDPLISGAIDNLWGTARDSAEDKKAEIAKYKAMLSGKAGGNSIRGREVFTRICQQCHTLFGEGGKVGPDITGSNRADLDYILETVVDPNAVIPNDYRTSTIQTKDERVITGIITRQDDNSISVVTANETVLLSRSDVEAVLHSDFSMMPDGLIQSLTETEVRDLIAYLRSPAQVPTPKQ